MNDPLSLLRTKYSHSIMSRVKKAADEYHMINEGDRIAVCISGGKDSMLLACVMKELMLHSRYRFATEFMVMDPGYSADTLDLIHRDLDALGITAHIFGTDIFAAIENEHNPCALCAKLRRGALYAKAEELGCSKIALGHHFDDAIETTLMGMIYGGQMQTMLPRLHAANFDVELIRPMYLVRERDVLGWRDDMGLTFINCACPFTAKRSSDSKRAFTKKLIADLAREDPQIEMNIYRSACNVDVKRLISYKDRDGTVIHNA
ncbi:MAG: tRNA 2-thiocytidine biosynthesis protein TtcA [Oscillospiraceae bacterium]|nr:tRNA 2-thiocytidine biosynthesis protein TtcA [Oscillospiraceae bacterium]